MAITTATTVISRHQHPNRTLESNGPETKVRGPAAHIYERYLQLARDAPSSGDRVLSENYLQHADHYFRLVRSMQPAHAAAAAATARTFNDGGDSKATKRARPKAKAREDGEARGEGDEQPDVEFRKAISSHAKAATAKAVGRRRGRRNRFRPEGEAKAAVEAREGGERSEGEAPRERTRTARASRAKHASRAKPVSQRRANRANRAVNVSRAKSATQAGPEGFSNGPKPAFLRAAAT